MPLQMGVSGEADSPGGHISCPSGFRISTCCGCKRASGESAQFSEWGFPLNLFLLLRSPVCVCAPCRFHTLFGEEGGKGILKGLCPPEPTEKRGTRSWVVGALVHT